MIDLIKFICFLSFCRTISASNSSNHPPHGLVIDGTPCGENLVCVNRTCVSLFPLLDPTKCPTDSNGLECYGNGVSFLVLYFFGWRYYTLYTVQCTEWLKINYFTNCGFLFYLYLNNIL